jgi:NADPH:quinone reductase-like Zn-dependent oxidoreductase
MRALQLTAYRKGGLALNEVPLPEPGPGELRIRVHHAGLNPVDWKTRDGQLRAVLHYRLPQTMGNEVAGEVDALGPGVQGFAPGERVFARLAKERMGGFADCVVTSADLVARIPEGVATTVAAGVPLIALTAWQCLFEYGEIGQGSKVLIHAGAGAVGRAAIQMAKHAGAIVTTTVRARGREVAQALGADHLIDYREQRFEDIAKEQDFVLDAVGGDTTRRSIRVLRRGGRLCSISAVPEWRTAGDLGKPMPARLAYSLLFAVISAPISIAARLAGVDYRFVFMRPDGAQLQRIAEQMASGRLHFETAREYPLQDFASAFDDLEHERVSGKQVLRIAGEPGG